jgi:hypothetical protein
MDVVKLLDVDSAHLLLILVFLVLTLFAGLRVRLKTG